MIRRLLRWSAIAIPIAIVAAAASVVVFYRLAHFAQPAARGSDQVRGLQSSLAIRRDPFGIPHISADSLRDALWGLGAAHAQDRIWQMDLLRRHARGELSELFGAETLPQDRLARTLGLGRAAEAEVESLPKPVRLALEAYAAGVNHWIQKIRQGDVLAPFESRWLGSEIRDWTVADSLAVMRFRSWSFSRTLDASLSLERLKNSIGGAGTRELFPERDPQPKDNRLVGSAAELVRLNARWRGGAGLAGAVGSLGFAVGASRTPDQAPILVNDGHYEFQLPALGYMAHIRTRDLEVSGSTWPGVPAFWSGTNRVISWGQVALHASTSDLYDETLKPDDPLKYDRNGRWLKTEAHEESIQVRYGEAETIQVRRTRHGPLLSSALPDSDEASSYALRWTGDVERSGIRAHLALLRAENWESFRAALRRYPAPAASFLYADANGEIGLQIAGKLPVRSIPTDFLPVPGRTRYYDWRGTIAFDELPKRHGDDLDFLVASTHPLAEKFPAPVTWLWRAGGAAERLEKRLKRARVLSLEDAVKLQAEAHSERGRALVRELVQDQAGSTERAARVRELLLDWDGATHPDSVGALVYHAFRQRLTRSLLEERLKESIEVLDSLDEIEPVPGALIARFMERSPDLDAAVALALDDTWSWLSVNLSSNPKKWSWGALHAVRLEHPFATLGNPWLRRVGDTLSRGPFPAPGDPDSIWAMYHGYLPGPVGVGPAVRYAISMADVDHAQFALAGGQSGHPGASTYDDAMADWLAGRPRPLWMHEANLSYHSQGRWEFTPEAP